MSNYRVEILGEYEGVTNRTEDGLTVVTLSIQGVGEVTMPLTAVTEVTPPLPPEPGFGEFVACGTDANLLPFYRHWHEGWGKVGDNTYVTWETIVENSRRVAGRDPLRLVSAPEPVMLPWKNHGVAVGQTTTDDGPGDHVHVSTRAASYGYAHLKPSVAREMARALWTAADQAEAAHSHDHHV